MTAWWDRVSSDAGRRGGKHRVCFLIKQVFGNSPGRSPPYRTPPPQNLYHTTPVATCRVLVSPARCERNNCARLVNGLISGGPAASPHHQGQCHAGERTGFGYGGYIAAGCGQETDERCDVRIAYKTIVINIAVVEFPSWHRCKECFFVSTYTDPQRLECRQWCRTHHRVCRL